MRNEVVEASTSEALSGSCSWVQPAGAEGASGPKGRKTHTHKEVECSSKVGFELGRQLDTLRDLYYATSRA